MKILLLFGVISAALIALVGIVLGLAFDGPGDAHAIRVSAAVAWPVQMVTFALARLASREQVIAAWGVGALIRFGTLAVYGLVMLRAFGLAPTAALLSLAAFFFVTMLVEPLLLTK